MPVALGREFQGSLPFSHVTGRSQHTACHDRRIGQNGRIIRRATLLLPMTQCEVAHSLTAASIASSHVFNTIEFRGSLACER
jgi:hypothetical protein